MWKEIRKRLKRARETEASFPAHDIDLFVSPGAQQATLDVDRLLTDADALLAVVRLDIELDMAEHSNIVVPMRIFNLREQRDNALAALPENLK